MSWSDPILMHAGRPRPDCIVPADPVSLSPEFPSLQVMPMLDRERAYFAAHADEWATEKHGRFVVVKDETLVGTFGTLEEALAAGGHRFGLQPFLVRQLGAPPERITVPALTLGLLRADP